MRIGHGYDVHRLTEGRRLVLGGVEISHSVGLLGHSDADVLIHSLCDALLGAAGFGDIGKHFPDTSADYKDIDSRILLRRVTALLSANGYRLGNADITVIAQKPKLAQYIPAMRENISADCNADISQINIKATTEEGLGFTGIEQGIAAHAVCLIEKQ